jgi:hypothetical protein
MPSIRCPRSRGQRDDAIHRRGLAGEEQETSVDVVDGVGAADERHSASSSSVRTASLAVSPKSWSGRSSGVTIASSTSCRPDAWRYAAVISASS